MKVFEIRKFKREITQKELAKKVGTNQPSIARLENGQSLPSLTFLKKVCDALNVELIVNINLSDDGTNTNG